MNNFFQERSRLDSLCPGGSDRIGRMILDEHAKNGGKDYGKVTAATWVKYTLAPLVKDGRNCLACRDVAGMEWTLLGRSRILLWALPVAAPRPQIG